jgi:hypothetical protein
MKAITTLFESMLGSDDTMVWTPTSGPTEFAGSSRGWGWTTVDGAAAGRGWGWTT